MTQLSTFSKLESCNFLHKSVEIEKEQKQKHVRNLFESQLKQEKIAMLRTKGISNTSLDCAVCDGKLVLNTTAVRWWNVEMHTKVEQVDSSSHHRNQWHERL